jgi:hypothetical protein
LPRDPQRRSRPARSRDDGDGVRVGDGDQGCEARPPDRRDPGRLPPTHRRVELNSVRDAWRHVRFRLVHSANWLFIVPGAVAVVVRARDARTVRLRQESRRPVVVGAGPDPCQLSCRRRRAG